MRLAIIFILFSAKCVANDSLLISTLFQNLLNKQIVETNFFVEGSFASFRQHNNNEILKADNNIFYTALVAYTLQDLKPYLTQEEIIVADTIINRAKTSFNFYKNAKKRVSYNFWRTDNGNNFFPNDAMLSAFKKSLALPDDLDDTSIILMAINNKDSTNETAHLQMQNFINGKYNFIKNTYKKYKLIPAYSTWYGIKMPLDFDFGVHCNILSFVNKFNLPWQKSDSATYNLLLNMIDEKLYINHPKYISPYYSYSPVLIYHIARLMSTKHLQELENRKQTLIDDAIAIYNKTDNELYKTLIASALLKWNAPLLKTNTVNINSSKSVDNTDFVYYTGHLFGHLNNTIKSIASSLNFTQYKWFCSAFNDCIKLEYLVLKYRKK